jgi:hypothetical protein
MYPLVMAYRRENKMSQRTISTHDTRAVARYNLAQEIIKSDNAQGILEALAELTEEYASMASTRSEQGDEASALRWARVGEELTTVVMCTSLNLLESKGL